MPTVKYQGFKMPKVKFIKATTLNGVEYKVGKVLNVIPSLFKTLTKNNSAVAVIAVKKVEKPIAKPTPPKPKEPTVKK